MTKVKKLSLKEVVGQGYKKYWNFKGRYRVVKGSRASKKSKTTALNFIYRIMKYENSNLLVVRKTYRTLKDSCFTELKWAVNRLGVEHLWKFTESPLEMVYVPTGQRIYFRGLDDPLKVTSITVSIGCLCWLWIEEAYEISKESDFDMLQESIRGQVPNGLFKQMTITFNPWSERHWLKRRFFDVVDGDILAITTNYLCNEWLDESDRKMFSDMKKNNPDRYEVAGLGNWGVVGHVVFRNYRVADLSQNMMRFDNIRLGMDFGWNDPTAVIKIHLDKNAKKIYVIDEIYRQELKDSELLKMAKEFCGNNYVTCDCAEPKIINLLASNNVRAVPCVKGADSIMRGIRYLQDFEIIIDNKCKNFIDEISMYRFDEDKFGNLLERPVDENNHLLDALRYAVESEMLRAEVRATNRI
ncbi:MAG: PBSX family phage terminase large subunit [bacterium]|nr:PBSX family phage terminase large subunit [bacterium]